jgi:hypothetical protein
MWVSEPIVKGDLTVILLTLNKTPKQWQEHYKKVLLEAIEDKPLIIVSKEKLDWGRPNTQYLYQEEPGVTQGERIHNIYTQLQRAVKLATTPYIATVDDDCLYPAEHFNTFRPPLDKLSYNYNRWSINTWIGKGNYYYYSPSPDNPIFLAPRQKLLDDMEPIKYFDGPATRFMLNYTTYYTIDPVVCFHHIHGLVDERIIRWKRPWPVRAYSLPKWGDINNALNEWKD